MEMLLVFIVEVDEKALCTEVKLFLRMPAIGTRVLGFESQLYFSLQLPVYGLCTHPERNTVMAHVTDIHLAHLE